VKRAAFLEHVRSCGPQRRPFRPLVNVFNFETIGVLGTKQLDRLESDLKSHKADTPTHATVSDRSLQAG
jgi:hypothetical protein